jgi:carotenoid cleavage dioxygenase
LAHADKLWALHEADAPYSLTLGDDAAVATMGRDDFGGKLDFPFTAHPKVDPRTGELLFYGYQLDKPPYCKVGFVDADGTWKKSFPVDLPEARMMHDCAITENYMIIIGTSIVFSPEQMVKENALPFTVDDTKPMLIGILPRSATSQDAITWFEMPSGAVFHTLNAWENGDIIELYTCCSDNIDLNLLMSTGDVTFMPDSRPNLHHMTFNMKTGETTKELICPEGINIEFPRINESYLGVQSRYGYLANFDLNHSFKMPSVVKVDITKRGNECIIGEYEYGSNCFGGEPVFVPKKAERAKLDEDDGYLLTLVYDEQRSKSYLEVIDAKTMSSDPLARIHIPERVPYGFHASFVEAD